VVEDKDDFFLETSGPNDVAPCCRRSESRFWPLRKHEDLKLQRSFQWLSVFLLFDGYTIMDLENVIG